MENSKLLRSRECTKGEDRSLPARGDSEAHTAVPRSNPACAGAGVATTCIEHAYGSAFRLSFQIKVF